MEKEAVVNLSNRNYPVAEYPENTLQNADDRLAALIAREFWEERRRVRKDNSSHPDTWNKRNQDDIKDDKNIH